MREYSVNDSKDSLILKNKILSRVNPSSFIAANLKGKSSQMLELARKTSVLKPIESISFSLFS